jgi:hypothetical protein
MAAGVAGKGLTVTIAVEVPQVVDPAIVEYDIVSTPAETPKRCPAVVIVAIEVWLLDQVPPVTPSVNVMVLATHTTEGPPIVPGALTTAITKPVALAETPLLLTVALYVVETVGLTVTEPFPDPLSVILLIPSLRVTSAPGVPPATEITADEPWQIDAGPVRVAVGLFPATAIFVTYINGLAPLVAVV